jgi:prostatic aicd phosphatase
VYQTAATFLQGPYPPIGDRGSALETINNETEVVDPLDGYQSILVHGEDAQSPHTI